LVFSGLEYPFRHRVVKNQVGQSGYTIVSCDEMVVKI